MEKLKCGMMKILIMEEVTTKVILDMIGLDLVNMKIAVIRGGILQDLILGRD